MKISTNDNIDLILYFRFRVIISLWVTKAILFIDFLCVSDDTRMETLFSGT
jgi:hypothetical protein